MSPSTHLPHISHSDENVKGWRWGRGVEGGGRKFLLKTAVDPCPASWPHSFSPRAPFTLGLILMTSQG